jgi:hypothetical protein
MVPTPDDNELYAHQTSSIINSMRSLTDNLEGAGESPDFSDVSELAALELLRIGLMLDLVCKRSGGTLIPADVADEIIRRYESQPVDPEPTPGGQTELITPEQVKQAMVEYEARETERKHAEYIREIETRQIPISLDISQSETTLDPENNS